MSPESNFLLDYFNSSFSGYTIFNRHVCSTAYAHALGYSRARFFRLKTMHENGIRNTKIPLISRPIFDQNKRSFAASVISNYVNGHCDHLPNADRRHLPSCISLGDIYLEYCSMAPSVNHTPATYQYFADVFRKEFPDVKIPKVIFQIYPELFKI